MSQRGTLPRRPTPGRSPARPTRDEPVGRRGGHRVGRRAVLALVLLLAVAGAAVALLLSPLLDVRAVEVTGVGRLSTQQVTAAAAVRDGTALATVDVDGIRARVGALPEVAAVSVHRSWPHTVRLVVTERTAEAYEAQPDGSVRLYDATGVAFASAASPPPGLPALALTLGKSRAAAATAAMSVLVGLPKDLRDQVQQVQGRSASSVVLLLADGRTVLWGAPGDAADTATKAAVVATLERDRLARALAEGKKTDAPKGLEIDVSTPTVAVVR